MTKPDIVLCTPVRTPIGTYGGALKDTPASDLGAAVIRETLLRSGLTADTIDAVTMGQVIQAGARMNPARQAAIGGGVPVHVPALTLNRVCGSGAQAIATAALEIAAGYVEVAIAGGMENMDQAPYLVPGGRWGYRMGDAQVLDSMLRDGLHDAFSGKHSGWHTEDLVSQYGITREDQDRWAARSQQRFSAAQAAGKFDDEIVAIELSSRKGTVSFAKDEANRPDTTTEALAKLKPAFRKGGTITAGNAPGLNSGAAAMIVAERGFAEKHGLQPWARLVSHSVAAVEPGMFGIGPVPAVQLALERANWTRSDVERIEINEAFAAIALACLRQLELPEDIVNVEGGSIAHGHAIGATGAVLTTRLLHSMRRDGLKRGIVTLCIGGGQGIALALEML
ncbi:Acetyl-CoA acetyltransferase [Paraburkholderia nemoris]|uniref:thiolase family protein n=1 Tax=Paraburkholderia nemoris TaxID=2793076 RepID=UPI00190D6612|nr:acetyl-CoA C-acetyltransferase [Paraburkholderia nemoris]MBK3742575.1 acetyl-CoA C-acetyltransferase [Paraburkholderia aspalathi]CAE6787317.1 Acetyl-CoA acetyltransferase [Paraburkholderia nemoris]